MSALVRTGLVLALMATPFLSHAQDDSDGPWWKGLFKQETVNELEEAPEAAPTPPVTPSADKSKTKPTEGLDDTRELDTDTVNLSGPFTLPKNPGVVTVTTPAAVDSLDAFRKRNPLPMQGYRIQIFQGSVTEAKEVRSQFVATRAKDPVHLVQTRPYFAIRIGDFRTELDAYKRLMEIREIYPGAYVVADRIALPPLR